MSIENDRRAFDETHRDRASYPGGGPHEYPQQALREFLGENNATGKCIAVALMMLTAGLITLSATQP